MPTKLLAGLDILVIEDESLLRKQIAAHLESLGAKKHNVMNMKAQMRQLLT